MVNYKHIMKSRNVGKYPVKQWYQSHGSSSWERPTSNLDGGFYTGRYLLRETPKRIYQWNTRKKSISPRGKQMLLKQVLENVAYNDAKLKETQKIERMKNKRDRKSKCYICREKGHAFWACENRKKLAVAESNQEFVTTSQILDEEAKYTERVHVIGDHMIEGSQHKTWNDIWYISNHYKFHLCPKRKLFKKIDYKFKMIGKEETERKFIFSYGIGDVAVDTDEGELVIQNVQYTPEVSLNILSVDLLEEQGYMINIDNTKCTIKYMFDEILTGKGKEKETDEENKDKVGYGQAVKEHNQFLEEYFDSLDPKEEEESLIKGLEELRCDRDDVHDYIDDDYISWNGTLYALKVNSFNRFLSFMNLLKKDGMVYKNWKVFSKRFEDMLKWFYLEYLNYDYLEELPPTIGETKVDLLALHKIVESYGGYVAVSLSGKWETISYLQGLTTEEGDLIKEVFKKFIDLVIVYHDTAQVPYIGKPQFEKGESSSTAQIKDPQGLDGLAVRDGQEGQTMDRLGVSNEEQRKEGTSSEDDDDFEVIV